MSGWWEALRRGDYEYVTQEQYDAMTPDPDRLYFIVAPDYWYDPEGNDPPHIKDRIAASIDRLEKLANKEDE